MACFLIASLNNIEEYRKRDSLIIPSTKERTVVNGLRYILLEYMYVSVKLFKNKNSIILYMMQTGPLFFPAQILGHGQLSLLRPVCYLHLLCESDQSSQCAL